MSAGIFVAFATGMYAHYTFHARGRLMPLDDHERCAWLWSALRRSFPSALGAALVPTRGHLVGERNRRRDLSAILGAFSRRFRLGQLWLRVDEPSLLTTPDKRQRSVRYVSLNPSRPTQLDGGRQELVFDPLEWPWTTHRDLIGAVAEPWVNPDHLADALGWRRSGFRERWHAYVSRDDWVRQAGAELPEPLEPTSIRTGELRDIGLAACAAHRTLPDALRMRGPTRTTFVALAYHRGWRTPALLSRVTRLHPQSMSRTARSCPDAWLQAAATCLSDERLLFGCSQPNVSEARAQHPTTTRSPLNARIAHVRG